MRDLPITERNTPMRNLSDIIDRPRLVRQLQTSLKYRLTLISAPPGYGKTTLAVQYVLKATCPVAWHSVEDRERDLPTLYARSLAALEYIAPGIKDLPCPEGYSAAELVTVIADYLRDNTNGESIYVLDDVHQLTGAPNAEAWLRALVSLLPENCHLMLISRALPPLPLADLIGRGQVLAIGESDLRFTAEEVQELANSSSSVGLGEEQTRELTHQLDGWPAGTVLALHPLPANLQHPSLSGSQGPEALFDALAEAMLSAQPSPIRDFLLASSTLNRLTPEPLSQALHLSDINSYLAEFQARNLFVIRAPGGMFYHVLFRSFLQRQLKDTDPIRFAELHSRAGSWYQAQDQLDSAFDHFLIAGDVERARSIAEQTAYAYYAQGKFETLLGWNARLRDIDAYVPPLLYRCAMVHVDRYEYDAAFTTLQEAEDNLTADDSLPGLVHIQLQRAIIESLQGAYQLAADKAAVLAQLPPAPGNLRGRALRLFGSSQLRLGNIALAAQNLEESIPLHRADGDSVALGGALQDLGGVYARLGQIDDALGCLQEVVALRRSLGSPATLALALNNLGYYYHRSGNYERAIQSFQEGLAITARFPNRRAESYLRWSLGDLQRDRSVFDEAAALYEKALELLNASEPALRAAILISASILQRWQHNFRDAESSALDAANIAQSYHLRFEATMAQACLWAARAQMGNPDASLTSLESLADQMRSQGALSELAQILGLCAHTALLVANHPTARQYVLAALEIDHEHASLQPFVAEIVHTAALSSLANSYIEPDSNLARELQKLRNAQVRPRHHPPLIRGDIGRNLYSLRVLTLGKETIERDGQTMPDTRWRATILKDFFFYMLLSGPQIRDEIIVTFWPDSPLTAGISTFHSTIHRIRNVLGENVITYEDNIYAINSQIDLWCDALEFIAITDQARILPHRDARTEDLWNKAIALYKGHFLPGSYLAWALSKREVLAELFVEALIGAGYCARARADIKTALARFKRALDYDPYREEVHRAIMSCYADMGEKKQILDQLQRLQKLLREELAIAPSHKTMALAQSLLK